MFNYIAHHLTDKTQRCVISFVDLYKNTAKNMSRVSLSNISNEMLYEISNKLKYIATEANIELTTCAEEIDLQRYGISHGKCIDDKLIEEIFNVQLNVGKDKNQRDECGCIASIDIGAYNTCPHGCLYCYANYNLNHVRNNYSLHNPNSPLLFGEIGLNDKISERKVSFLVFFLSTFCFSLPLSLSLSHSHSLPLLHFFYPFSVVFCWTNSLFFFCSIFILFLLLSYSLISIS